MIKQIQILYLLAFFMPSTIKKIQITYGYTPYNLLSVIRPLTVWDLAD
ncbi:MAG: hypothetical protein JW927_23420 [Deltaproteobacteria bacterium]|nr:hypothetical protein [Deltaproteobacteria bacterium]